MWEMDYASSINLTPLSKKEHNNGYKPSRDFFFPFATQNLV